MTAVQLQTARVVAGRLRERTHALGSNFAIFRVHGTRSRMLVLRLPPRTEPPRAQTTPVLGIYSSGSAFRVEASSLFASLFLCFGKPISDHAPNSLPPFFLSFPVSHSLPASVAVCPLISLDSLHYFYGRDSRRRATLETPPLYRMRCGIAALRWTLSATAPPSAPAPRLGTFRGHSSSSRSGWIEQTR